MCRGLLDRSEEGKEIRSLTFEESDMRDCVNDRAAIREEAARKRKPRRQPVPENARVLGSGSVPVTAGSQSAFVPGRY